MENSLEKHHIINDVIKELEATSYLEIGFADGFNFNKIKCESKTGTDINFCEETQRDMYDYNMHGQSSDNYFNSIEDNFDVVFIDGLHHADQVRKDITNSMKCNAKAVIIHDVLPKSKEMQEVPRIQKEWTGDVWRAVVGFIEKHPDVRVETYRSDYGLTVIYPNGVRTRKYFENLKMTYEEFKDNEIELLNIID